MKISAEEVEGVALLARLSVTAEEKSQLILQLDAILEYMDKLNQLNTAEVEPFTHATETTSALREDAVTNQPNPEALLANAPARDGKFFKVPKIIE